MKNKQEISIDDIFTPEWYDNVVKATNFALKRNNTIMRNEDLALYIIDYNITKRLQNVVLDTIADNLPKRLDWRNKEILDAFAEFKDVIDTCDISTTFKNCKITIVLDGSEKMLNELLSWKVLVNEYYTNLDINLVELKTKNMYKLEIKRIN